MTLTIYGVPRSRAIRNIWMAEELGTPYTRVDIGFGPDGCRSPAFLAINPNGHIPAIDDGGVILSESLAINLHLARTRGGPLAANTAAEDGQMTMWSFWAASEAEIHAAPIMYHTVLYPEPERDPVVRQKHMDAIRAPLAVLDAHLAANDGFLVGGRFTVADLNVACVIFYLRFTPELLAAAPTVKAWYEASMARPACRRAFALRGE